jgi:predicted MFS family arabinose efflux permease
VVELARLAKERGHQVVAVTSTRPWTGQPCRFGPPGRDAPAPSFGQVRRSGLTVAGLAAVPAAANGLGRFGYGLVLPAMQHALGWSAFAAGSVGAANTAGYLLGALSADRVIARLGTRRSVLGGLLVATAAVAGCATTGRLPMVLALRLVNGVAAAVAFVAGAVVVVRLADREPPGVAGRWLGLYFAGPGLGIALSAVTVSGGDWRRAWLELAGASAVALGVGAVALRSAPAGPGPRRDRATWDARAVAAVTASYGIFGAGYIAFMTFVVAYLRAGRHTSTASITTFWFVLGAGGVLVGVALMARLGQARGGRGVALLTALTAAGSALPLVSGAPPVLLPAALLFGCFFSVSAAATAAVRARLPAEQWPAAIAGITAAFGLGQCLGPLLSGALSDGASGLRVGLLTGTALLVASAACALLQPVEVSRSDAVERGEPSRSDRAP